MARYSRRRGPASQFTLTSSMVLVPGLSIERFFDGGELFIAWQVRVEQLSVGSQELSANVQLDGTPIIQAGPVVTVPQNLHGFLGGTVLAPIARGVHLIEVHAAFDMGASGEVDANSGQLSVLQLPIWDSDEDIL